MWNRITTEEFIKKARLIHGDKYGYDASIYLSNYLNIKIFCKTCNKYFMKIANSHLKGSGCKKCKTPYRPLQQKNAFKQFINNAIKIHGNKYGYEKIKYINSQIKIKIFCNKCKHYFFQIPNNHISGMGCPLCSMSKGEEKIRNWLLKNNITSISQKIFYELKSKKNSNLKFDFYLPHYNICIEYDGHQHFFPVNFTGKMSQEEIKKQFIKIQENDELKNKYCKENNILLLRIAYGDFNNIESILENKIKINEINFLDEILKY